MGRRRRAGRWWRAWLAAAAAGCAPVPPAPPPEPLPPEVEIAPLPAPAAACPRILRIDVRKAERRLRALCEGGAVVRMTVALGREPRGPKLGEGDLRTPEGLYRVSGPARASRFHRFIPIDYPSPADAEVALLAGRISADDHARILSAHAQGLRPPWDTPLGGGLGLHGEGHRWRGDSADLDWTFGCLAVSDVEIDFLAERVEFGTPVRIDP